MKSIAAFLSLSMTLSGFMVKDPTSCLLIIDVQNDFTTGSLAVPGGLDIIPTINNLREKGGFGLVALTQDWHPAGHVSFYSSHNGEPGAELFKPFMLANGQSQTLWPDHCLQGSTGAEFDPRLVYKPETDVVVQKGIHIDVDSYSGFMENDKVHKTALDQILKKHGIRKLVIVGLVLEFCVSYSALDARALGYDVTIIMDATRPVAPNSDNEREMIQKLKSAGVKLMSSNEYLSQSSSTSR